ncbi:MAG: hypothetical protein GX934_09730 [Burkholderiales bacterium]|jgi:hypothetical protein|nr:hypothetical protein [Burkholderiales bacterium]
MPSLQEGNLRMDFPPGWDPQKYDDWAFYRQQFSRSRDGMKAVDVLAWQPDSRTAWLVELKDYRLHPRTKGSPIHREVADKVLDTLAALLPAAVHANDETERAFARKILKAKSLRVVLHLEQPKQPSKLFPRALDPADVQQKLCQVLRPVDPHPRVVEKTRMGDLAWNAI